MFECSCKVIERLDDLLCVGQQHRLLVILGSIMNMVPVATSPQSVSTPTLNLLKRSASSLSDSAYTFLYSNEV